MDHSRSEPAAALARPHLPTRRRDPDRQTASLSSFAARKAIFLLALI